MLEAAEHRWKWLELSRYGWNFCIWNDFAPNDWKWLEWSKIAEYSCTLLDMARTGWEWLNLAGMTGNG